MMPSWLMEQEYNQKKAIIIEGWDTVPEDHKPYWEKYFGLVRGKGRFSFFDLANTSIYSKSCFQKWLDQDIKRAMNRICGKNWSHVDNCKCVHCLFNRKRKEQNTNTLAPVV